MSLSFGADDCNQLPSMENWLSAGPEWSDHHHEIIEPTTTQLFYPAPMFQNLQKEAVTQPFLKLDKLELCKETPSALRMSSTSMVESSDNSGNSVTLCALPPLTDVEASLYTEADSPRGPLSPAALQLGKSPRSNKRTFDDVSVEAASWMRKSPKQQYPSFVPTAPTSVPLAIPAPASAAPTFTTGGALFSAPLTLPTVPSLEEIAQTRPKRRNVRISKDPQSVAARHRRERISDRVRVLQHFVPGGTKMDTASMLDEAINYVKFLQQQLQTMERIGNCSSYDPRFMATQAAGGQAMMMAPARAFDLNYAVYPSSSAAHPQQATWPNASNAFSDAVQEQFCH